MRPSQTSSARGCSLTCGIISRGCNCLRRWRWVKSKIIVKLLVLTNCPSGGSDIILEQQAGAPWSLRVGLRPRIFAVEGKILPAHIFTHPWSHWCGILSAQNRGSEKPITPVPKIMSLQLLNSRKEPFFSETAVAMADIIANTLMVVLLYVLWIGCVACHGIQIGLSQVNRFPLALPPGFTSFLASWPWQVVSSDIWWLILYCTHLPQKTSSSQRVKTRSSSQENETHSGSESD